MYSRTAIILAIALPLGLCLVISILISVFLCDRDRVRISIDSNYRGTISRLEIENDRKQNEINKLRTISDPGYDDTEIFNDELVRSYTKRYYAGRPPIAQFMGNWISKKMKSPPIQDEAPRLKLLLLNNPPHPIFNRDISIFPNVRQYTATDIAELLSSSYRSRCFIIQHIMVSILLKNTSLNGHPSRSLLPFFGEDIDALYNLSDAMRKGLELRGRLRVHITRFGTYKANNTAPKYFERQHYYKLFEDLLHPYFKPITAKRVKKRHVALNRIISDAVDHGLLCLRRFADVGYEWEMDKNDLSEVAPMMYLQEYHGKDKQFGRKQFIVPQA